MRHFIRSTAVAIAMATASTFTLSAAMAADLSGAGSTFIYPVFAKWADTYKKDTGIGLNYQSIGSGGGIKQVEAKTVTFGATDKPLADDELTKNGLVQFPMVMGGIVAIVNIDGVKPGDLVLDGPTLAGIFMGKITSWDDPAIKALSASLALPTAPIVVAHRSDGSGTTFNFTNYLGKESPDWLSSVGSDTAVEWPVGVGAKGSEGVANAVKQTAGSIGYVEYAYAKQNSMSYAKLVNANGKTVEPNLDSFAAAASNADFAGAKNFNLILTNQPGDASWPITATTWVLIHAQPDDAAAAGEALKFFDWAYTGGKDQAKALDYVAIPDPVVALVEKSWAGITAGGKPVFAK
jgi:phosphate transport system substrate-binding protein